jgi:ribosomal protein S6--L-glutamate ligase
MYSNKRIMEAGEMRGHEMHFLNIKECYMRLDAKLPKYIIEENYFRSIWRYHSKDKTEHHLYGCALTRVWSVKVYCLNSAAAITQSRTNYIRYNYF